MPTKYFNLKIRVQYTLITECVPICGSYFCVRKQH